MKLYKVKSEKDCDTSTIYVGCDSINEIERLVWDKYGYDHKILSTEILTEKNFVCKNPEKD